MARILNNKTECCGCGACEKICPSSAIEMQPDTLGFLYPQVDSTVCVNCGLCDRICNFIHPELYKSKEEPSFWAARHNELGEISKSRSGAVFAAISDYILDNEGIVYGAAYDSSLRVVHKRAGNRDERDTFRGSKYVQSDLRKVYSQIITDLKSGNNILFSGTGCQVAGIKSFVPIKYQKNLYTVDVVCHGAPSPTLFHDYLDYCKKQFKKDVLKFEFRDKTRVGWSGHEESILLKSGKKMYSNIFTRLFYTNVFFRDSCYECPYASIYRTSDITLADYWGWEQLDPSFNSDNKGCSLVLVNTIKGQDLFFRLSGVLTTKKTTKEQSLQRNLKNPTSSPTIRKEMIDYYINHSFDKLVKKYINVSMKNRVLNMLKRIYEYAFRKS